ncbi:hydroxylysine kinase-like [Haliotis rufescens]|uniref:hydroxylysine kinase-like n=1 Tax=Haliotis rufescens TaxID=6454 RepID=UPI00201EF65A|nr:hydroxylysine kinase-like [Haliotis rufescens]
MANAITLATSEKPSLTVSSIGTLLARHYGLHMTSCQKLNSYEDLNFRVKVESNGDNSKETCCHGYIFKVANKRNSQNTNYIEAQHEMMSCVLGNGILAPRAVPTLTGHLYLTVNLPDEGSENTDSTDTDSPYVVRLFEYIPGTIIQSVPLTPGLCYKVGEMAGRVDTALKGFDHSGFHGNPVIWRLDHLPLILDLLHAVEDNGDREMVSDVIKTFQSRVLEHLNEFPQGMIHGDLNEGNILVTEAADDDRWRDEHDVSAILDYSDSAYQPYIFEVAIGMTYMSILSDNISPQTASGYVLAGYLTQNDLSDREIKLLKLCVCARITQSLVIGAFSFHVDPSNDYTLNTARIGWPRLRQLWKIDTEQLVRDWRNIARSCEETRVTDDGGDDDDDDCGDYNDEEYVRLGRV